MIDKTLTIGADPELALVSPSNKRYVPAQTVFTPKGYATTAEFGFDGNPNTVELRPKYSTNPLEVVDNIYKILDEAKKLYPPAFRLELMSSDMGLSIGGHIHLGHKIYERGDLTVETTRTMDALMALPCSQIEIPEHRQKRIRGGGYGKLGDYRGQTWGFEYRTLPSWLATRELAEGILSLAYAIGQNQLSNPQYKPSIFTDKKIDYTDLKYLYDNNMMSVIRTFVPWVFGDIKKLELYPEYKKYINYFISSSRAGRPLLATEIKEGWHIKFLRLADLKLSDLASLIQKLGEALTIPQEVPTDASIAQFGNDYRVEDIANHLSQAVKSIVGEDILSCIDKKPVKIRGLKASKGNKTLIYTNVTNSERLLDVIRGLYKEFEYNGDIGVVYSSTPEIFISRDIRDRDDYLAEAITLVVWLYINREAYKSKIETKNGKSLSVPFTINTVVKPLCVIIKDHKRPQFPTASEFMNDDGELDVARVVTFVKNNLISRLEEARRESHRVRLPRSTRDILYSAFLTLESNMDGRCVCRSSMPFMELCEAHLLYEAYEGSFSE